MTGGADVSDKLAYAIVLVLAANACANLAAYPGKLSDLVLFWFGCSLVAGGILVAINEVAP